MSRSPQCYIPGFVEIGSLVPEKKSFEGFLPYMSMVANESVLKSTFNNNYVLSGSNLNRCAWIYLTEAKKHESADTYYKQKNSRTSMKT